MTVAVADKGCSSQGEDEEYEKYDTRDLPSPPSGSPIIRAQSPVKGVEKGDAPGSKDEWHLITNQTRIHRPLQIREMDHHLSDLSRKAMRPSLKEQLRAAFVPSTFDARQRSFLPSSRLRAIVTQQSVQIAFDETPKVSESEGHAIQSLTDWIVTRACKLFAILNLCGFESANLRYSIRNFKDNEYDDSRLPLENPRKQLPPSDIFPTPMWSPHTLDVFYEEQWRLLVPVFSSHTFEYNLQPDIILPFTVETSDSDTAKSSFVRKVEIHPDHGKDLATFTVSTNLHKPLDKY
ncbi:hypothetical protein N0V83_005804 [Neocucurbitaria cava]|uniref:Uncharacterized protein n=1 Tax=Neocucurbitaria cava TaxID=798079 RepID=A0A9W8YAS4_9PLEO|nr:hypothetical protein N0V83_005804 [Neocucurbitaria cava]